MFFEEVGDWDSFEGFFETLANSRKMIKEVKWNWRDFMRSYRWWAIKGLVTEGRAVGQNWIPNARGTTLGIRTGHYRDSIERMKISTRGNMVTMKFSDGDLEQPSHKGGSTLGQYMLAFEYGSSKGQPPRPLWEPAFEKTGGRKKLYNMMLKGLKKSLNKQGFNNVSIKTK